MIHLKPLVKGRAIPCKLFDAAVLCIPAINFQDMKPDDIRYLHEYRDGYIYESCDRQKVLKTIRLIADKETQSKLANIFWKYELAIDERLRYVGESKSEFYERRGYCARES